MFKDVLKDFSVELGMYLSNEKTLRKSLKEATRVSLVKFNQSMLSEIGVFERYIQGLNIERAYLEQVKNL